MKERLQGSDSNKPFRFKTLVVEDLRVLKSALIREDQTIPVCDVQESVFRRQKLEAKLEEINRKIEQRVRKRNRQI